MVVVGTWYIGNWIYRDLLSGAEGITWPCGALMPHLTQRQHRAERWMSQETKQLSAAPCEKLQTMQKVKSWFYRVPCDLSLRTHDMKVKTSKGAFYSEGLWW